jgi:hypothetical protein
MTASTVLDREMNREQFESAYLNTDYRVNRPEGTFAIRIGEHCAPLEQILNDHSASTWAYITACNPYSQPTKPALNAHRMRQLATMVTEMGYRFFRGEGAARTGDWPLEPSLLILGINEAKALELARHFEQLAFVFGESGLPARLVWTKEE